MNSLWENYSYIILFFSLIFIFATILVDQADRRSDDNYICITIKEGDSLWKLAEEYSDKHHLTTSEFIAWIEKTNGINGSYLVAGTTLTIPVLKNEQEQTTLVSSEKY